MHYIRVCVVCVCVCTTDKRAIHLQCLVCATLQGMYSLEDFLVSMCTSVTADGAEWVGLGGAVVPAPRRLPLLLELPRRGGTEQGLALHVMSSMTASLPSLLPPGHNALNLNPNPQCTELAIDALCGYMTIQRCEKEETNIYIK